MAVKRDTYKYHFDVDNVIVETGITHDLRQRESELRGQYGCARSFIQQVGMRPVSHGAALDWLEDMRALGRPVKDPENGKA